MLRRSIRMPNTMINRLNLHFATHALGFLLALAGPLGCKDAAPEPAPAADVTAPRSGPATAADGAVTPALAVERTARSTTPACVVELVDGKIRTAAGEVPIPIDPEQGDVHAVGLAVWPGGDDAALVALVRDWFTPGGPPGEGILWQVPCDRPDKAEPVLRRAGADFAHAAISPDGWTLYFSDAHGIGALDLETREVTTLTEPGTAWPGCWTADAPLRDLVLSLSRDGLQLAFARGGPCGAEGSWLGYPWTLMEPQTPSRRQARPRRPLSAVAAVPPATLWLSDGGACDEPGVVAPSTRGAVWRSEDQGATWTRVAVGADGEVLQTHARALLVDPRSPDRIVVHGATCRIAERGTIGGQVFASDDRGATWHQAWPNQADRVLGLNGGLETVVVWVADGRRFGSRDLGRTWFDLDRRPPPAETPLEPVHLGDAAFAGQDDGLYRRSGPGTTPTKVFPPPATPEP